MMQTKLDRRLPALILIDIQEGFRDSYWGTRNNPRFEENAEKFLREWRKLNAPIFHVQHLSQDPNSPLRPESSGVNFMEFANPFPTERIFQKKVNSAFIGTDLEGTLKAGDHTTVIVLGLTTDHCVSTSVRMGSNLGFRVFVPSDAVATFNRQGSAHEEFSADLVHQVSLASLHREFATVMPTRDLISRFKTE